MSRSIKTFILWLLIAALPVQGFAAAMKLSCGTDRYTALLVQAMSQDHAHRAGAVANGHYHADGAMHHHADATREPAGHHELAAGSHDHKSSFCSACAICCAGAVGPPPAIHWSVAPGVSQTEVIAPAIPAADYFPAGLRRPPRHLSA
jgi:hypothetical protein